MIDTPLLLGEASSRSKGKDRWTEVQILRRADGTYTVTEIGRSTVPGESDRVRTQDVEKAEDLREALERRDRIPRVSADALTAAAGVDENVAGALNRILYPSVSNEQFAAAREYEVRNQWAAPAAPAYRFRGWQIGFASSRIPDVIAWREVTLYRTLRGTIVGVLEYKINGETDSPLRLSETTITQHYDEGETMAAIVRGLTRPGVGFVDGTLLDAIDAARAVDPAIAKEVDRDDAAAWAHPLVGSTTVRVGDGRHEILARLAGGARLRSVNDRGGKTMHAQLVSDDGLRDVSVQLFMALSRQRLIRKTDAGDVDAGEPIEWEISPKGDAVLLEARPKAAEDMERTQVGDKKTDNLVAFLGGDSGAHYYAVQARRFIEYGVCGSEKERETWLTSFKSQAPQERAAILAIMHGFDQALQATIQRVAESGTGA